jgi:hypothetical protein
MFPIYNEVLIFIQETVQIHTSSTTVLSMFSVEELLGVRANELFMN